MSRRESLARYSLIIQKLKQNPSTFAQIERFLSLESEIQGYNFTISSRTFTRDRDDIRSLYNIDIQFDFSKKVYYIVSEDQPEANERILEAFDVFNAFNLSSRMTEHIQFEKRKPQGTEHLFGLLHAIKNKLKIKFRHQNYWDTVHTQRDVAPYALKEFKSRWYLLAKDKRDEQIKSFALDRLSELEITKQVFDKPIDFDVNEYFTHCFGIIRPVGQQPEKVILTFNAFQGKYIKSLPLHTSQQVLIDTDDELRIELTIYLTHDFFMELLSFGENVKVLEPKQLIENMKSVVNNIQEQYKK